jgi:hypothetical protein
MDRKEELEDQVRRLTQTVDELRGRMAEWEGRGSSTEARKKSDRRGFLRLGAGAVLGALGMAASKALPAAAADGQNVILGTPNFAAIQTTIQGDVEVVGPPIPVFAALSAGTTFPGTVGLFTAPLQGHGTSNPGDDGVDGWAGGSSGAGVYGLSDTGYGVIGESSGGIAVYARSSGRLRQDGPFAGMPAHAPNAFEQVRDSSGVLWIHNAAGAWRRVNTVRVDAASGSGAPFTPFRLVDTRGGSKPAANSTHAYTAAGQGSGNSKIPSDAIAVLGNLTATQYSGGGFLTISPGGVTVNTSTVNFITGQSAIANSFVVGLSGGKLQVHVSNNTACHFLVDITGYIQ